VTVGGGLAMAATAATAAIGALVGATSI